MTTDKRLCGICGAAVTGPLRRKYCTAVCAEVALDRQLEAAKAASRAKAKKRMVACAVCGEVFQQYREGHLYCKKECQRAGIARAVEAQRQRRNEAIRENDQAPTPQR